MALALEKSLDVRRARRAGQIQSEAPPALGRNPGELVTDDAPGPRERGCRVFRIVGVLGLEPIVDPAGVRSYPKAGRQPANVLNRHDDRVEASAQLRRRIGGHSADGIRSLSPAGGKKD